MSARGAAAAALAAVLLVPASAGAATKNYSGENSQGNRATAKVVNGKLYRLVSGWWRVGGCDGGDDYRRGPFRTTWRDRPEGPIEQEGGVFSDGGTEDHPLGDGRKVTFTMNLSGRLLSGGRIKGKQTIDARFYDADGKEYDRCRGKITFRLKRK